MITIFFSLLLAITPLQMVPNDLAISYQGKLITTLTRDHYALPFMDGPFIDEMKQKVLLDTLEQKVHKEPKNAILNEQGDIVEGKPGITLDRVKFRELYRSYYYNGKPTEFEIPTREFYPRIDSELLADIKTREMGRYLTYYKTSNKERSHNIMLAAKAINNHVLFPGETFSFNKVVGKRTKEKGYKRAPVIVRGELAEGIGGGICQVSSTLFNAVDFKGLEVIERYSHSRSVPYVPEGRDATVSWYGPDFAFKNKLNQPVLIRASAKNGKMAIIIYSSESAEMKTS